MKGIFGYKVGKYVFEYTSHNVLCMRICKYTGHMPVYLNIHGHRGKVYRSRSYSVYIEIHGHIAMFIRVPFNSGPV